MPTLKLPKSEMLTGGSLADIVNDIQKFCNPTPSFDNGYMIYYEAEQYLLEPVLTHDNVLAIVAAGGDIQNYIMYAKVPLSIDVDGVPASIYDIPVPDTLPFSTMQTPAPDLQSILTLPKTLDRWCNNQAKQYFSVNPPYDHIYIATNAPGWDMTAEEIKVFVEDFQAQLLTRAEFNEDSTINKPDA